MVRLPANRAEPAQFDIVVIGGGPGGYATALYAGAVGPSVALVEKDKVGGTCLHRGCVPAKEFLETVAAFRSVEGANEFGIQASQPIVGFRGQPGPQEPDSRSAPQRAFRLVAPAQGHGFRGVGRLLAGKTVEVTAAGGEVTLLAGRNIVLASGSVPRTLPGFDVDGRYVLTSDELLDLRALPRSMAVIGAGAIGCEFASMLADLGARYAARRPRQDPSRV